jgi:cellulose synthase/poly-beta-1,6-N-acetylglucosamine synthase-like glycosyltransferase
MIIPTRPGQSEIAALTASRLLDYPRERLEMLVARGRQPSVQRNDAIKAARGDLIYFLDDDASPDSRNLRRAVEHFKDPQVTMVGGPNLCPPSAPILERVFAVALGSWLAFGPSRARYAKVGGVRASGEKELILCNLAARRADLIELGGFNEALYPNEENALMDQLQKRGRKLLYDPEFIVHRRPRPTLRAFITMLMTYGRGRAEQFRLHPTPGSILNFVPPLFCLYLLIGPWFGWVGLAPLAVYGVAVVGQTIASTKHHGLLMSLRAFPFIVLTHVFYGIGFWRGLFTRLKNTGEKPRVEVTLERIPI